MLWPWQELITAPHYVAKASPAVGPFLYLKTMCSYSQPALNVTLKRWNNWMVCTWIFSFNWSKMQLQDAVDFSWRTQICLICGSLGCTGKHSWLLGSSRALSCPLSVTAEGLLKQFGEQAVHHHLFRKKYFVFSFLFCYLCSPREMFWSIFFHDWGFLQIDLFFCVCVPPSVKSYQERIVGDSRWLWNLCG